MSVDFYAAVDRWPTQAQMELCAVERSYPIKFERFPAAASGKIVDDGILATVDDQQAYLEGEIFPTMESLRKSDVETRSEIANMLGASNQHYLLTIRIGSRPSEFIATAYVISSLVHCFGGIAYEPQGKTRGKVDFANALLAQVPMFKAMMHNAPNN
jgi:hypothetical protein